VEVKKLRAFLRMLAFGSPKRKKRAIPHKLKKMYSILGKIRDRQLLRARLENTIPHFKTSYAGTIISDIGYSKTNMLSPKALTDIERKIRKKISGRPERNTVKDFLREKSGNIESILKNKKYTDNNLHTIRKELKDINYTLKLPRKKGNNISKIVFLNRNDLKKAETIANNLGLFNDACNTLSYLSSPALKKAAAKDIQGLQKARKKWIDEKRMLRKQFRENIPDLKKICTLLTRKSDKPDRKLLIERPVNH
jgi:CHAD domain-containing protein